MSNLVEFLRPSSAATWTVCSGYVRMRAQYPEAPDESDNDIREDGTACHWLAAELWEGRHHKEGTLSPNNRLITDEMFDAVDVYHDVLRSWQGVEVYIERPVDCSVIYPGMSGTPDAWAANFTTRTLYIGDLKFGFKFVEVWENLQLLCYILALITLLNISGLAEEHWFVEAYIVQPRSTHRDGPVRKWRARISDLRALFNIITGKAADAMRPDAPCTPNPGCADCPARFSCVALQHSALTALESSYASVPLELDAAAAGDELRRLVEAQKRLEARITGLQSQVESMIRNGQVVPYWSMEPSYARETWREGTEAQIIAMGAYYGANVAKPAKPITPAQARKVLPTSIVAAFAHKPSTGVRLVKQDPLAAKKKFSQPL